MRRQIFQGGLLSSQVPGRMQSWVSEAEPGHSETEWGCSWPIPKSGFSTMTCHHEATFMAYVIFTWLCHLESKGPELGSQRSTLGAKACDNEWPNAASGAATLGTTGKAEGERGGKLPLNGGLPAAGQAVSVEENGRTEGDKVKGWG